MPGKMLKRIYLYLMLLVTPLVLYANDISQHTDIVRQCFPGDLHIGKLEGAPLASAVFSNGQHAGYAFYTDDISQIPAYSGKTISTLVCIDAQGKIVGVKIVHHEEPILVTGVSETDMQNFTRQYIGFEVTDKVKIGGRDRHGYRTIDGLSGATITAMVLNATINKAVREVAISRGLIPGAGPGSEQVASLIQSDNMPVWVQVWQTKIFQIVVLSTGLFILFVILIMQDWLVRHAVFFQRVRLGYLLFTTFFIGWYMLAQLSIVNVLTFVHSFVNKFMWENFLIDPMLFILWSFVAMSVLLWGRGVYCGWLCPFGALQELIFRLGERFRIRSIEFPDVVHERLWAIKYIILLGLFGLSLQSMIVAEMGAEIEPFKTVFSLHFQREWGYVFYSLVLLLIALFNRKFYCRYLCVLGAALTFPSRFRIFDWLRRRKECGRPCQVCEQECEVRAIRPTGEIIAHECHYCMDCQVTYWDDHKCPPLIEKRKKRQRLLARNSAAGNTES